MKPDASDLDNPGKVLSGLLGLMVHDLRSPLTALQSNLDYVCRDPAASADAKDAIVDGLLSCDALAHMIDNCDLLALALGASSQPPLGEVAVHEVVADVIAQSTGVAASYGQAIEVKESPIEAGGELRALSDVKMLSRALANLVRNSVQHSPPRSTLHVSSHQKQGSVEIWVEDQGPAVPDDLRTSLFTAEGQLSSKLHRGRYSRAMGLYCARIAAERCGAQLSIEDHQGVNNTFVLRLAAV
ncbi:MAG TPA: HAMP domain-containing sensor histidine kinase [Polyangiaceae bacterium]|nr:HAMP domain-containing sensor histidine kinase [Polyangiaceae bacterium]